MNKIFLIIKKEFLGRVKKRSFIVATILTPILMPLLFGGIIYMGIKDSESQKPKNILVLDNSGLFDFSETGKYQYTKTIGNVDNGKELFANSDYFAYLYIPEIEPENPKGIQLFSNANLSINETTEIKSLLENQLREYKIKDRNIDSSVLAAIQTNIKLNLITLSETGEEKRSDANITFGIGYVLSFLIYMFVFVYGAQVMQSVIEEKTGKVVEIIISIVKPMQLMLGKVMGIASVGLFQFFIWIVLIFIISTLGLSALPQMMQNPEAMGANAEAMNSVDAGQSMEWLQVLLQVPYFKIIGLFLFYFVFGFLLYGAMFAAVGSAVESAQEAQQFVLPITIPMLISIIGSMSFVIQNPSGSVSFWLSVIPFTALVSMMGRIAFDVPLWELLLSMFLLVLTTLGMLWAAGRIYRVGILNQGAKVNYKILWKWFWRG